MSRRSRRRREVQVAGDAIATVAREHWAGDMLGALGDLAEDLRRRAATFEQLRQELEQYAAAEGIPVDGDALAAFAASTPERRRLVAATVEGVG